VSDPSWQRLPLSQTLVSLIGWWDRVKGKAASGTIFICRNGAVVRAARKG